MCVERTIIEVTHKPWFRAGEPIELIVKSQRPATTFDRGHAIGVYFHEKTTAKVRASMRMREHTCTFTRLVVLHIMRIMRLCRAE